MKDIIFKDESYKIVGACMEVHKEIGNGFSEAVYQEALEIEFKRQSIPYVREKELNIYYKGKKLRKKYFSDFVCYDKIIIELKAINELLSINEAQVINYLKASGFKLGILINFGQKNLAYKRLVRLPNFENKLSNRTN